MTPKFGWLAWEAEQNGGYAQVSHVLRTTMQQQGAQFVNAYIGGWDLLVAVCTPTAWLVPGHVKRPDLVVHTMFEAEPLPPGWVANMNAAGLIWTPSQYCVDLFQSSGVTTPIVKTGYGIDANAYAFVQREVAAHRPMRFGIWAENLMSRKNVLKSVKAFIDAALPEAELEIKLNSFAGMNPETAFTDPAGRALAEISIHTGNWPRPKLVRWLQRLDCLIYLSGGEGFGLMPLEAAATGLPVILHDCSGMREYANSNDYLLVESDGTELAASYAIGYGYQARMPKPSHDHAVAQIRWAYEHRAELAAMGARASYAAQQWTWDRAAQQGLAALTTYWESIRAS